MAQDPKMIAMFEKQYDSMPAADKAKIPISKEEFLKQVAKMSTKATLVLTGILEGIIVIYLFILLWFFTKINVRRQFG
jgi:hypothetical protein